MLEAKRYIDFGAGIASSRPAYHPKVKSAVPPTAYERFTSHLRDG